MGRARRRRTSAADPIEAERSTVAFPVADTSTGPPFPSARTVCVHPRTPLLALCESEVDMLGAPVPWSRWLGRVSRGRGAAVCTHGTLSDVSGLSQGEPRSFQCVLDGAEDAALPVTFRGPYAAALHEVWRRHTHDAPMPVFLSGFGGDVVRVRSSPPRAGLVFSERVALKALLHTDAEEELLLWFEGDRSRPTTLVMQPPKEADEQAAPPPSQTSTLSDASLPSWPGHVLDLARPGTLDGTTYTPLADVEVHSTVHVMGVVMDKPVVHLPRARAHGGMTDAMVRLAIQPPKPWDGGASLLVMNLFARHLDRLPTHVVRGDALLVRQLQIQAYQGKAHGVGPAFQPYAWAACHAPHHCTASPGTELGAEERAALVQMVQHGTSAAVSTHPLVTLDALQPNTYVDMIVEVVRVKHFGAVPDLFVADYTTHPLIQGHDALLAKHHARPDVPDHMVFQIGLWGQQAGLSTRLQPRQLIRINNVRIKTNALGMLQGSLGTSTDRGYNVAVLSERDPLVQPLCTRRAEWLDACTSAKRPRLSPPSPVRPPRFELWEAEEPLIRSILDGYSPAVLDTPCCVLRVSPEHDWLRTYCSTCHRILPQAHAFCTTCADEDGHALVRVLHLVLHVCDASDAPASRRGAEYIDTLPLVATGHVAAAYLGCSVQEYESDRSASHDRILERTTRPAAHPVHVRASLQDHDTYIIDELHFPT